MTEEAINGKGLRIVLETEGVEFKESYEPWIIQNKEGLDDHVVKGLGLLEGYAKALFTHKCTKPECNMVQVAKTIMEAEKIIRPIYSLDNDLYLSMISLLMAAAILGSFEIPQTITSAMLLQILSKPR